MISIEKSEAEAALAAIGDDRRRSGQLYGYARTAPYLFLTGAMWLLADAVFQFAPAARAWVWPVATLVSAPVYIIIAARQSREANARTGGPRLDAIFWRAMALWVIVAGFLFGAFFIFRPQHGTEIHSFIGLSLGVAYAIAGLFFGARMLLLGLAIAGLTLLTHAFVDDWYVLVMGLIGGGGMMLGAVWLRRV